MILTDKKIECTTCKVPTFKPGFIDNKPYDYACGSIIEPEIPRPTMRDTWVLADSHNYSGEPYRKIRATFEDQLYLGWVINREVESCFRYDGSVIYINLTKFN